MITQFLTNFFVRLQAILSNMAKTPIFVAVFSYDSVTCFYFTFLPTIYAAVISNFRNHYLELMTMAFIFLNMKRDSHFRDRRKEPQKSAACQINMQNRSGKPRTTNNRNLLLTLQSLQLQKNCYQRKPSIQVNSPFSAT